MDDAGRDEERAAVVAFLRANAPLIGSDDTTGALLWAASVISRGEHTDEPEYAAGGIVTAPGRLIRLGDGQDETFVPLSQAAAGG